VVALTHELAFQSGASNVSVGGNAVAQQREADVRQEPLLAGSAHPTRRRKADLDKERKLLRLPSRKCQTQPVRSSRYRIARLGLDFGLLRDLRGVYLDAEVAHGGLELGVAQEQLHGA
jgi:hypothetical protein